METADTITDFSTGTDKIDIATVGNYVEADGAGNANIAAFITDADASLPTTSIDIYAEYNFNGEGNTLVVIDEDKSGKFAVINIYRSFVNQGFLCHLNLKYL